MISWLFAVHVFTTFAMTGVIWFVQGIHYPLFEKVGLASFGDYENTHTRLTGYLVGPLMLGELVSGFALALTHTNVDGFYFLWVGFGLIGFNWLVTFALFVPMHRSLRKEYRVDITKRLVSLNWIRTFTWTLRSGLLLYMIYVHY